MGSARGLRRLVTGAAALAVGGVVAQATFVFIEAIIAQRMGPRQYGIYAEVYVYTMVMVHIVDMGMHWQLIQDGARDAGAIRDQFGTMLLARVALFLLAYPAILAMLWGLGHEPSALSFFAIFGFFGLFLALQDLFSAANIARRSLELNALFQASVPVVVLALVLVLVLREPSLTKVAIAYLAGGAAVTATWGAITWRRERPLVQPSKIIPILSSSFHYGATGLIWNVYLRIGVLLLSFLRGVEEIAFFAAAYKLTDLGFKIAVLANRVVAPGLYADSHHRPEAFERTAKPLLRATIALGAIGAVVIVVVAHPLVNLIYGPKFAAAGYLLQILAISLALKTVAWIAQTVISAMDQHGNRLKIVGGGTVVAIVIAVPLTILWGAQGCAVAVVTADVIMLSLLLWRATYTSGLRETWSLMAWPIGAAAVCIALAPRLPGGFVGALLALPPLYFAALWFGGYLTPIRDMLRMAHSRPPAEG